MATTLNHVLCPRTQPSAIPHPKSPRGGDRGAAGTNGIDDIKARAHFKHDQYHKKEVVPSEACVSVSGSWDENVVLGTQGTRLESHVDGCTSKSSEPPCGPCEPDRSSWNVSAPSLSHLNRAS